MTRIVLERHEIDRAIAVAEARNRVSVVRRAHSNKIAPHYSELDLNVIGVLGEFAAARAIGVPFNETVHRDHGDDGVDLEKYGITIQVKTSPKPYRPAYLIFNTLEGFVARAAILVRSHSQAEHDVLGIISRQRFVELAVCRDFRYGVRFCVPDDLLSPIGLLERCRPEAA